MSPSSTAVLAAEVMRLAANPDLRKLFWRMVDAISAGLSVELVIREPEAFDPLAEMREAEATRPAPPEAAPTAEEIPNPSERGGGW